MKKNAFSLCLAGTVLFGTVTTPALALSVDKLTDVSKNDWFYPYVQYVAEKEYMVGVAENTFAPNMQVTRAMFVTTLAALDGASTSTARTPFTDVADGAWYSNAVKWAYANGIVAGVSATEFAPNAVISREQMCVMMSAFLNYRANKDDVTFKTTVDEKTFPDAASISTWAKDAVKKSQMWGLVAGDENGNMNPRKAATRAEAAVMLKQLDAVLAAGISNGGSSGGGGGSSSSKTADYTVEVTVSVPDSIHTSDLYLFAAYSDVKIKGNNVTGDKTVSDVAKDLTSGENDMALLNAVSIALDKVTDKTTTRTIKGKTVTVTVDEGGKISATVEVQVTDLLGDEQVGNGLFGAFAAEFLRPDRIPSAAVLEYRHIQRKVGKGVGVVLGGLHGNGFFLPCVLHGVAALADERIGADIPDVRLMPRGKVDDPFAHDVVQLGRPDVACERAEGMFLPNCARGRGCDPVHRVGTADLEVVVLRAGSREVIFPVRVLIQIGVCALGCKWREISSHISFLFYIVFYFI